MSFLASLALVFLCGLLLGGIFQKLKLPSLIGMLIAGIILGPYVLNLIGGSLLAVSADLRQIALIIILTRAGLSLDLNDLKKIGRPAVLMSFIPACFEMAATIIIAPLLFNISLLDAAILAAVVASASPAVIVPRMLKLMDGGYGTDKKIPQLILAGDSIDDIFNIVVFTALIGFADSNSISAWRFAEIPVSIILGVIVGIIAGFLLALFFKRVKMRDSVKVIILLSAAFLLVALEELIAGTVPFSALLSVMTMGVIMLKRTPITAEKISIKFSKLWVGAEVLLFVLVGASMNINYATAAIFQTLLMLLFILTVRGIGIFLCLIKTNLNKKERLFCTFTGVPKATVQAAIGGIPLAMGLASGDIILSIAILTILITAPLGAFIIDATYKKLLAKKNTA